MALRGRGADSAKTRIWTRGSQTIVAFVHAARKRRRAVAIGAVVAVVFVAAGTFGVLRYLKADAAKRVVQSYSALSACLVGELDAAETPSRRVRAIQLNAVTQADKKRVPAQGEPWPDRCKSHAFALAESLQGSTVVDSDDGKALLTSTKALAEALSKPEAYHGDFSDEIDATLDGARKLGLAVVPASGVEAPEAPAKALTVDDLKGAMVPEAVDLATLSIEPARAGTVRLVVKDKLCRITAEAASCQALGDVAKPSLQGTADDGADGLVFGAGGRVATAGAEAPLIEEGGVAGHDAADGTSHVITEDGGRYSLHRVEGDKTTKQAVRLPFGVEVSNLAMLWRHAVALGSKDDDNLLFAGRLDGTRLGSLKEIASLTAEDAGGEVSLDGCQGAKATVARMSSPTQSRLSFWLGERWTAPVSAELGAGVDSTGVLSCHGTEATITRYEPPRGDKELTAAIAHQRCTPKACQSSRFPLSELLAGELGLAPKALITATGVAGKVLVVWGAGQRGGLRMRLAPANTLTGASDVILFDDLVAEGKVTKTSSLSDMKVVAAESFAVVLLNTTKGVFAVQVHADGRTKPLEFEQR